VNFFGTLCLAFGAFQMGEKTLWQKKRALWRELRGSPNFEKCLSKGKGSGFVPLGKSVDV